MATIDRPALRRPRIRWTLLAFLGPAVLIYSAFMVFPLFDSLRLSLFAPGGIGLGVFVGLQNYVTLLTDPLWSPRFWGALGNNLVFFAIHMLVQNPIGLLLAALLTTRTLRGRAAYRALIFAPTVLSVVIVGFVARVDGAGPFRIFSRIQLPLIAPTVGIVAVLTFVGNFNAFDLVYSVQGGMAGPEFSTDLMGTFFYRTFFGFQLQLGNPTMGATVAGAMFVIILFGVCLYLFGLQRRLQTYEA